jgi:hypothetical protein
MKTVKFTLMIQYEVPDSLMSMNDIERAHKEVFEDSPGDFINYILNKNSTIAEYVFNDTIEDFECGEYFYYEANEDSNICRRSGALCSNLLCKHLK